MEIHFEIENKCILKCKHCSSYSTDYGKIMQYAENDMVSFLSGLDGLKEVYLTGGEPLLYPEINQLLYKLSNNVDNIALGLFTTGIILNKRGLESISKSYAAKLAKNGLKVCYISVYSYCAKEHDWMTGQNGSFELTKNSIISLINAGIEVRFNVVVSSHNIEDLDKIIKMAESWDVSEVRLLKLIRHGRAENCWDKIGVTESQYRTAAINIINKKTTIDVTVSGLEDIIPCRKYSDLHICPAGVKLCYITYDGKVFPCASVKNSNKYLIGNICDIDILANVKGFSKKVNTTRLCVNV